MSDETIEVMLYDRAAELVYDYSENRRFADESFIKEISDIVKDLYSLDDYLKETEIDYKSKITCYNPVDNTITVNPNLNHNVIFKKHLKDKEYYYWFNLNIVQTIFHELEHARQEKVKKSDENSIEKTLIVLNDPQVYMPSFEEYRRFSIIDRFISDRRANKYYRYYKRHHDLAPVERMANIKSISLAQTVSHNLPNKEREGIYRFKIASFIRFYNQIKNGYKLVGNITNNPSLDFLIGMKHTNNKDIIEQSKYFKDNDLDFLNRLLLGLSLTKDEYYSLEDYNVIKK